MAELKPEILRKRAERAWEHKERWRPLMTDVYALAFPSRNYYVESRTPGQDETIEMYDSTLQSACVNLANKLQTDVFSNLPRLVPGLGVQSLAGSGQAEIIQNQLETINAKCHSAINLSNFDQSINELLLDYGTGTGTQMMMEGTFNDPLRFISVNPAHVALSEGVDGVPWEYHRRHCLIPRMVKPTWESQGWIGSAKWEAWSKEEEANASKIIIDESTYYDYEDKSWYFAVYYKNFGEGRDEIEMFVHKKIKQNVWLSPRWNKEAGEVYGRGPALYALPDARVLNRAVELILKNASSSLYPPLSVVNDLEFNPANLDLSAGAINIVASNSATGMRGKSVEQLILNGDLGMAQLILEDYRANIKRLMLDDQMPPASGAVRSPTEIIARQNMLERNLGAPLGRLNKEYTRPMFQNALDILAKKKLIEPIKIDGLIVDLQVVSPGALAQQEQEILNVQRLVEFSETLGESVKESTLNTEKMPRWMGDKLGVSPSLLRGEREIQQIQKQMAEVQANEMQMSMGSPN